MTLSFKSAAGAAFAIAGQNIKIICFADVQISKLRVDSAATAREKQDGSAQGRSMMSIYRTNMHASSAMSP
jgi:hypothetical protein